MKRYILYSFRKNLFGFFCFLCLLTLYIVFRTNTHLSYGQDALEFSYWIENGVVTKINRHFLWNLMFFYFFKIWNQIELGGGALKAGQILSAFFGASGVMLFYFILKKFFLTKRDYFLGWIFTGFFAFSFGSWHFSGEANPQTFSNFLRLFLLLLIVKRRNRISFKNVFLYGAMFAFILLSEIMGFYLLLPYMVMIYFFTKTFNKSKSGIFSVTSIVLFFILYGVLVVNLLDIELRQVIPSILWRAPNTTNFLKEFPIGILYLFLTMAFMPGLRTPSIGNLEIIKLQNIFTPFNIIFFSFLCVSILIGIKYMKKLSREEKGLACGCFLWFFILFCIQIYREPRALDNLFYILPPLWILMFLVWRRFVNRLTIRKLNITKISLIAILLFFIWHNFILGIYPNSKESGCEMFKFYQSIKNKISSDDKIILISASGGYELYEIYYLLKYKSDLDKSVILLDGGKYRAYVADDKNRYDYYKSEVKTQATGNLYVFITPKLDFDLEKKGDTKRLVNALKEIFYNSNSQHAKHSIMVMEELIDVYSRYIVLDNRDYKDLDCDLIQLVHL